MTPRHFVASVLCLSLFGVSFGRTQQLDQQLSELASKLATQIKEQEKKKVAVVDFTDLSGKSVGELGKFVAEELTLNLVMAKRNFSVLDRANLNRILAEHKLTATGLINPDNAKKLGQFAGVDALVLGTIIPRGTNRIMFNAKIIATDTAEIVGASRVEATADETVQHLLAKPVAATPPAGDGILESEEKRVAISKTFGDLRFDVESLRIVNGNDFLLIATLTNSNPRKSLWVALNMRSNLKPVLFDPERFEFDTQVTYVSGIQCGELVGDTLFSATEIKAGESLPVSIKYFSRTQRRASPGQCTLHLGILLAQTMNGNQGGLATAHNFIVKMEAR